MRKNLIFIVTAILVIAGMAGCGTVPKKVKEELGGIRSRVETLEERIEGMEAKQAESEKASGEQRQAIDELRADKERYMTNVSPRPKAKKRERVKEIQAALKNAGFYKGEIDGIKGKDTREAIMAFQRENNLNPDGIVGRKTWGVLSKYLEGPAGRQGESITK